MKNTVDEVHESRLVTVFFFFLEERLWPALGGGK